MKQKKYCIEKRSRKQNLARCKLGLCASLVHRDPLQARVVVNVPQATNADAALAREIVT
jgi:hypothetical protein